MQPCLETGIDKVARTKQHQGTADICVSAVWCFGEGCWSSQVDEGQCRLRVLLCLSQPDPWVLSCCSSVDASGREGGWCLVVLGLAVCLAHSKATEGGECSGGPSDGQALPGPGDHCSSLPGRACQSPSVLACCLLLLVLLVIRAVVGGNAANLLASNGQFLFPQLSSGRHRHSCSFGNDLCLLCQGWSLTPAH